MTSVLMCVHHKDNPAHLDTALESLHASRTAVSEVVIVEDFPTTEALEAVIAKHRAELPIATVRLDKPTSFGEALNAGLDRCSSPLVARFDGDDIALPDRFEKQLRAFANDPSLDLLGGQIEEFDENPDKPYAIRKVPLSHIEIVAFAKLRNPINHMTAMFRRDSVKRVNGYVSKIGSEDYDLWVRMLQAGCRTANLPDILVKVRAGAAMARRRGGRYMLRDAYCIQKRFLAQGFISFPVFLRNVIFRGLFHAIPTGARSFLYRAFLRRPANNR